MLGDIAACAGALLFGFVILLTDPSLARAVIGSEIDKPYAKRKKNTNKQPPPQSQ